MRIWGLLKKSLSRPEEWKESTWSDREHDVAIEKGSYFAILGWCLKVNLTHARCLLNCLAGLYCNALINFLRYENLKLGVRDSVSQFEFFFFYWYLVFIYMFCLILGWIYDYNQVFHGKDVKVNSKIDDVFFQLCTTSFWCKRFMVLAITINSSYLMAFRLLTSSQACLWCSWCNLIAHGEFV